MCVILATSTSLAQQDIEKVKKKAESTSEAFQQRLHEEQKASSMLYSFSAHKPFYFLPVTYNSTPSRGSLSNLSKVDYLEVKFQFSFKFDIVRSFLNDSLQWSFAYTNLSFWQLYNDVNSRPFRETNHEPDIFIVYHPNGNRSASQNAIYRLGFVHQSNGQDVPESRSWNRIYFQGIFNLDFLVAALKVWYRLPEAAKVTSTDSAGDDNPDILEYMGNFELQLNKKWKGNTFTILFRNSLRSGYKGGVEFDWSFPLNRSYKGLFQVYNGYGESLIDYNRPTSRVGLGILMADWL